MAPENCASIEDNALSPAEEENCRELVTAWFGLNACVIPVINLGSITLGNKWFGVDLQEIDLVRLLEIPGRVIVLLEKKALVKRLVN